MNEALDAIFQRRAVKVFEPVEISEGLREQILNAARHAPQALTASLTSFIGRDLRHRRPSSRNCASVRSPRKPPPHWSWPWPTSNRCRPRCRPVEWMRRSNFTEEKIATSSGMQRSAGSCSCPAHSECLLRSSGPFPAAESAEGDRMPPLSRQDLFKMGDEKYLVSLPESNDRRRSAGYEHMSDGRL